MDLLFTALHKGYYMVVYCLCRFLYIHEKDLYSTFIGGVKISLSSAVNEVIKY